MLSERLIQNINEDVAIAVLRSAHYMIGQSMQTYSRAGVHGIKSFK